MALTLVIGNKNYSSWSMRPWMALRAAGIAFDEVMIPILNGPADRQRIVEASPSGKIPLLIDGDIRVWDSLAIIEYAAERFPEAGLWPQDRRARAVARAISAEMHSGFIPLRSACPMNIVRPVRAVALSDDALANIDRIQHIWADCVAKSDSSGPFLFGRISAADAMFAPVIHRFLTYAIDIAPACRGYVDAMIAQPDFAAWTAGARAETLRIAVYDAV
jgi:glutathione S-transferase